MKNNFWQHINISQRRGSFVVKSFRLKFVFSEFFDTFSQDFWRFFSQILKVLKISFVNFINLPINPKTIIAGRKKTMFGKECWKGSDFPLRSTIVNKRPALYFKPLIKIWLSFQKIKLIVEYFLQFYGSGNLICVRHTERIGSWWQIKTRGIVKTHEQKKIHHKTCTLQPLLQKPHDLNLLHKKIYLIYFYYGKI